MQKFPSQYIPNAKLIEVISKVTNSVPNLHILKKRRDLIKEITLLSESKVTELLSRPELEYLKKPRKEEKLPVFLSEEEISKMLNVVKKKHDSRSEILILFLYNTGCRPSEAARIKIADINFPNKYALITKTKGKKERTAHIFDDEFLNSLKYFIGNKSPKDYVFISNWNKPYTVKGITKLLKSIAFKAGLNPSKVSAHKFRHTHAVHAIKSGVSLVSVRDQLGHSNIAITDKYTRIIDSMRRNDYEGHKPFSLIASDVKKKLKYCQNCGIELLLQANFCSSCGNRQ